MHTFNIDNETILIDEKEVLDNKEFLKIQQILSNSDVNTIIKVAFILRFNYEQSRLLMDMAHSKGKDDSEREMVQTYIIGLMLQHNHDVKSCLEDSFVPGNRRFEYLKGIFFMKNNQYQDAEFCFETAGYKKGIDFCKVLKNDVHEMEKISDPIVQCYLNSKNWKNFNHDVESKDFLFIIGKSKEYEDEGNVDVQITIFNDQLNQLIEKETNQRLNMNNLSRQKQENFNGQIHNKAEDMTLIEDFIYIEVFKNDVSNLIKRIEAFSDCNKPSAYIFYLIGKMYHLIKDFEKAQSWYNKSLSIDSSYLPSQFNLNKIQEIPFECNLKYTNICDFNALISLKKGHFDFDFAQCSGYIRKLYRTIVQSRKLDKTVIEDLKSMKNLFGEVEFINNLAIIQEGDDSIRNLESELSNSIYKDYILYNLGVMKKDVNILKESILPEAQIQIDYLTKNRDTKNSELSLYLRRDKESVSDDTFGHILCGFLYIDEYFKFLIENKNNPRTNTDFKMEDAFTQNLLDDLLDKAEECLLKEIHSQYAINGLGICAILRGNISAAIKLFEQLGDNAKKNLANCYILSKDYSKAAELYLKGIGDEISLKDRQILKVLGLNCKDSKILISMVNLGIDELKSQLALVYLSNGDIEMAKELCVSDPEVQDKIEKAIFKEEERKRKIAEIEEYRKRQRKN